MDKQKYEVIIIGGSYAGLSAALALGRSLRRTLIMDSGKPCNQQTPHSHNFLTQDGVPPAEIASLGRQQLNAYETLHFTNTRAIKSEVHENHIVVTAENGERFSARKLILATGIKDQLPAIPGFSDSWGISLIHCPYCHGFEYRNQRTGILANGAPALHYAQLISNLTPERYILTNGKAEFDKEGSMLLQRKEIPVIEKEILKLEHRKGYLQEVIFTDHSSLALDALYARVPFIQHSEIPQKLGCTINEQGLIETDMMQKTSVPHVFACGDNSSPMRSVANAVAGGNVAGAVANMELCGEEWSAT